MTKNPKPSDIRLNPQHYSSLRRLVRVTACIKRFLVNCKIGEENRRVNAHLQPSELAEAETFWLRRAQQEGFPDGDKDRRRLTLNPQKDIDGIIRANERLAQSNDLPYDVKHFILLPKDHTITKLIIVNAHEKLGHGTGVEHLLTELRTRFWITKGRRAVRNVVESCRQCHRRFRARPGEQMMAPLPKPRVTLPLRTFDRIGVDYDGPFLTKQGRGKSKAKRYLCLFTCLATRAVHLEIAYALDTSSFLNAFTRMTARRGMPSYVVSDNGTNFVGAEKELQELVQTFDQDKIVTKTTQKRPIEWKFNPPSASHFGGVFEILIKSAKKALKAIVGDTAVSDEELHTAIYGVEGLLNSRPITYVSSDPNDLVPLTPNHF